MDLRRILNDDVADPEPNACPIAQKDDRVGKWSREEERYAAALITHFLDGTLAIAAGTSLRSFLADNLRCSAMRVSTKLAMDALDGRAIPKRLGQKRFFPRANVSPAERQRVEAEVKELETAFYRAEKLDDHDHDRAAHKASAAFEGDDAPLRVGSWSREEQVYASALIDAFLRGLVAVQDGMTLRAFLADRLCCNPMRVSKKLATGSVATMAIPKRLGSTMYHREVFDAGLVAHTEYELGQLRLRCFPSTTTTSTQEETIEVTRHASPVFTPPARRVGRDETLDIDPAGGSHRVLAAESPTKKRRLASLQFPSSPVRLPSLLLDMRRRISVDDRACDHN